MRVDDGSTQAEQASGVRTGERRDVSRLGIPCPGEPLHRVRTPGGLVALPAIRDRCEVGTVALDEEPVVGDEREERVVGPFLERDDAAEGDVPAGGEGIAGECVRSREAVEHSADPGPTGLTDHCRGVVLGLAGVDDDRAPGLLRDGELVGEGAALERPGRVVVVVVETAFPDGDGAIGHRGSDRGGVLSGVVSGRIVRMHAGCPPDDTRMRRSDGTGPCRRLQGLPDADDAIPARVPEPLEHTLPVTVELRAGEVRVRIDPVRGGQAFCAAARECGVASDSRGYFFSIQSNNGDAT